MYVVCVRKGERFDPGYVAALKQQVRCHLGVEAICLGDDIESRYPFTGYWSKIELFAPDFPLRPCLYIDLDTFILDDISDLMFEPDKLWLIRDFFLPRKRSNSGLMLIPRETSAIWEASQHWGTPVDGDFLETQPHEKLQDHFPGIVSYKKDCMDNGPPPGSRIVCFHGKPKPHEADGWAETYWNALDKGVEVEDE